MSRRFAERIAAAPISWGVCEVPGWGWQYDVATVLGQMRELGLVATEFGPEGFLPDRGVDRARVLAEHGLHAVGGFVPVVLHEPRHDPVPAVRIALEAFVEAGARTLVLAAATGRDGYDERPVLDEDGWATLVSNLGELARAAAEVGVTATLHPHVGTMVENAAEVRRVLDDSGIGLCLDTGHLLIGGADPVALARDHADRVRHVHLKDVDAGTAAAVRAGRIGYADAVREGLYRPLGQGDVDIAAIVTSLEQAGYDGWYVLEQDTVLAGPPTGVAGEPQDDVRASVAHLRAVAGVS
jgi:inosose dehydratase